MYQKIQHEILNELSSVRDVIRYGASAFNAAELYFGHGTDNAWDEAVALALHALHLDHSVGEKILEAKITRKERGKIAELFQQRIRRNIPAPYLTHEAWFAGLPFYVDERVLIPRSPIAELIENHFQPWINSESVTRILDIGTGSACIAIAAAYHFTEASIDAVDIDADALAVAEINVAKHDMLERVQLIQSDVFSELAGKKYDVIIANPPYVDAADMASLPKEFSHEPSKALAAGEDGLDYAHRILADAPKHLTEKGILILEVGNSAAALEQTYPDLPFVWLEFERGGSGVCLIGRRKTEDGRRKLASLRDG